MISRERTIPLERQATGDDVVRDDGSSVSCLRTTFSFGAIILFRNQYNNPFIDMLINEPADDIVQIEPGCGWRQGQQLSEMARA